MFVYSVKSSRLKSVLLTILIVAAVAVMIGISREDTPAANDGGIVLKAGSADERTAFLSQFGWEIEPDPSEVAEVVIPVEFDEEYSAYNEIQKHQNFDLSLYAGKRAKRWTYEIKNYPGYENREDCIFANLLVYEGVVIGGDVCSTQLDGFVAGFDYPERAAPQTTAEAGSEAVSEMTSESTSEASTATG